MLFLCRLRRLFIQYVHQIDELPAVGSAGWLLLYWGNPSGFLEKEAKKRFSAKIVTSIGGVPPRLRLFCSQTALFSLCAVFFRGVSGVGFLFLSRFRLSVASGTSLVLLYLNFWILRIFSLLFACYWLYIVLCGH